MLEKTLVLAILQETCLKRERQQKKNNENLKKKKIMINHINSLK